MNETDEYDYVIVGGGIGGCVLASHLPDGASVLLLEAGPDARADPRVTTPSRWPELLGSELDWGYLTVPQRHLDGRRLAWPRGRALGGSAAINAMVYIEGAATDYDAWSAYGGIGWNHTALRPWFPRATGAAVTDLAAPHPLAQAFVAAAQKCGLPANPDFNSGDQTGVGLYRVYQHDGARWTAAGGLTAAVDVWTDTRVTRVVTRASRATAVEVLAGGHARTVRARREILLCAGTIGSAQLLLLSGLGPADDLRRLGIPVVADLPGVGANLHDHVQVSVSFHTRTPVPVDPASNLGEAGGFVRTRPDLPAPDLQLSFAPMIDLNAADDFGAGFTIGPAVTRPASRGRLRLATAQPSDPPLIDPNYLSEEADRRTLAHGVELAFEIAGAEPLVSQRRDRLVRPPAGRTELDEFCRRRAATQFHPVGTCRMGRPDDPEAVVDTHLRVHGVEGLAVVDASVIPSVPTGNIAAAVHAIAQIAAADPEELVIISAVIFDWDGTLVDSHEAHFLAMRDTLSGFGLVLERSWADAHTGTSTEDAIAQLAAEQSRPAPEPVGAVAKQCASAYLDHLDRVCPVPWVVELARSVAGRLPTAVASGASRETVRPTMTAVGLGDLFPVVVTREDVDSGKPSPDLFLLAAKRLGVPAGACLVVEDSDEGIEAAHRAGMAVIDVRTRSTRTVNPAGNPTGIPAEYPTEKR